MFGRLGVVVAPVLALLVLASFAQAQDGEISASFES